MQTPICLPNYRRRQLLKLLPSEIGAYIPVQHNSEDCTLPGNPHSLTHQVKDSVLMRTPNMPPQTFLHMLHTHDLRFHTRMLL